MLSDEPMMPPLKAKWRAFAPSARATLEAAFKNSMDNPYLISRYDCYIRKLKKGGEIEFHHFNIGYATFVVAIIDNQPAIIWDAYLNDGLPLYRA